MVTRAEHVRWCKERALEYVNAGDLAGAVTSMLSELGTHKETAAMVEAFELIGLMAAASGDRQRVILFIEGFTE